MRGYTGMEGSSYISGKRAYIEIGAAAVGLWLFLTGFALSDPAVHGMNRYSRISLLFHDLGVYGWRSEFVVTSTFFVVLLALLLILRISKVTDLDGRMRRHILVVASVYALILVAGNILSVSGYLFGGPFRVLLFLASILKWYGLSVLLTHLISMMYWTWESRKERVLSGMGDEGKHPSFILCWGIILLAWTPYIILNFPGIVTVDGFWQFRQVLGEAPVTDHHPVLHTALLWLVHQGSRLVHGTNTVTLFSYVIMQAVVLSGIYAYLLRWLTNKGVRHTIVRIILLYYALLPLHGYNATFLSKDFLSAGFLLLAFLFLSDYVEALKTGPFNTSALLRGVGIAVIAGLLRNNVLYAMVLSLIVLAVWVAVQGRERRSHALLFLLAAMLLLGKGSILHTVGITGSPSTESLSVPVQQIARTLSMKEEIPEEIADEVLQFFTLEELKELYDPYISDPVKFTIAENGGEISSVMGIWAYLLRDNLPVYIDSFLLSNYGYWYPQINFSSVFFPGNLQEYEEHGIQVPFNQRGAYITAAIVQAFQFIPVLNLLSGIGFMAFLLFLSADYTLSSGQMKRNLIPYLPLILSYLTLLVATPMTGVPRYAHFLFSAMPVFVILPFLSGREKGEERNSSPLSNQGNLL